MAANYLAGPSEEWTAQDGSLLYSPNAIQGKRAYAMALSRNQREAKNAGDGISNAANSIFAAMLLKDADSVDKTMLTQQKQGGDLFADSLKTPGSYGEQNTFSAPGASRTNNFTPGTPVVSSAWDMAIDKHVPEDMRTYARALFKGEGGMNGERSPTGAWGAPQWTKGTGKQYGLINERGDFRNDPEMSVPAFVSFTNDNRAALTKALGREPTWGELALAHQQGAGGASALLRNPNAPAGSVTKAMNLSVNNIDPNLTAGAAAQKIMGYYKIPEGPQPQNRVQVAQAGPNAQMGVQIAPGVQTMGGATGSGITPQHIAAAKWAMANPSLATAEQKAAAQDIYKRAQEPTQWQDLGEGYFRAPDGSIVFRAGKPERVNEGDIFYRRNPDGSMSPANVNGGAPNGNVGPDGQPMTPGVGGHRLDGTIGYSKPQQETLARYAEFRKADSADAVAAANERSRLGELQKSLSTVDWRGPATAYIQPLREWGRNLGMPDVGAIQGQSLEMVSRSMMGTLKTMADNGRITQGEYQSIASIVPNLGTLPGAEQQMMNILKNVNARRVALGQLAQAYDMGELGPNGDKAYMQLRQIISNDPNAAMNFGQDEKTGAIVYRNPMNGRLYQLGGAN